MFEAELFEFEEFPVLISALVFEELLEVFPDDEFKDALSLDPADSVSLEFSLPFAELSVFVEMLESTCGNESTPEELLSLAVQPAKTEIISTKTNKILCNLQILIFIINLPSQINYVFILLYWTFRQISTLNLRYRRKNFVLNLVFI